MKKIDIHYFYIALFSSLLFFPFLGNVHLFDWDEINFAECAREMLTTGDYLRPRINFEPFWEKPPIFMWFQAVSMHVFGVNEYAARFPNAVCGIVTLCIIYGIGKKLYNKTFGLLWVLSYVGSILPHLYFKSGIIDPWFNLFIFLSLYFLIQSEQVVSDENRVGQWRKLSPQMVNILCGGLFSGLAILTKGPVGFLIVALTWLCKMLIYKELSIKKIKHFTFFGITAFVVACSWFGVEIVQNGFWFVNEFIIYTLRLAKTEDAGHGGFVGYHFVVLLIGCFPASVFAVSSVLRAYNFYGEKVDFTRWMRVLFWVVLILFSIVQSKIVHYSSMCYLPLTFLSAITLKKYMEKEDKLPTFTCNLIVIIGLLLGLLIAAIPFIGQNIAVLKPLLSADAFAIKNLDAVVTWHLWTSIIGFVLIIGVVMCYLFFRNRIFTSILLRILRGSVFLFLTTIIFIQGVLFFYVDNIEAYSQRAAIDFYQSKQTEDCVIETFGFKSYAHLFYSKKPIPTVPKVDLLREKPLKQGYFVAKITSKDSLDTYKNLRFMYEKNGFVFYKVLE